jgi:hypothetical protein
VGVGLVYGVCSASLESRILEDLSSSASLPTGGALGPRASPTATVRYGRYDIGHMEIWRFGRVCVWVSCVSVMYEILVESSHVGGGRTFQSLLHALLQTTCNWYNSTYVDVIIGVLE